MDFPAYRKYPNNKSFFKIVSASSFEELTITGKYFSLQYTETKILPERNFLNDMLYDHLGHWEIITGNEYEEKKKDCIQRLVKMEI